MYKQPSAGTSLGAAETSLLMELPIERAIYVKNIPAMATRAQLMDAFITVLGEGSGTRDDHRPTSMCRRTG